MQDIVVRNPRNPTDVSHQISQETGRHGEVYGCKGQVRVPNWMNFRKIPKKIILQFFQKKPSLMPRIKVQNLHYKFLD